MKPVFRLSIIFALVACLLMAAAPRSAGAHPMGNFSTNQYSALTVGGGRVQVSFVLDLAEIPTFQELATIRPDRSTNLTPQEREGYMARKSEDLRKNLSLTLDGKSLPLTLDGANLTFPLGNSGLPTLRFEMELSASLDGARQGTLEYRDNNYTQRVGWKEVIANPGDGVVFEQSSVAQTDQSKRLTEYNTNATINMPEVLGATIVFGQGAGGAQGVAATGTRQGASAELFGWLQDWLNYMVSALQQPDMPIGVFLTGLLIAFGWGGAHALSPGHGKTVVAAYLVGSRGTPIHAVLLGLIVTVSHTVGVFALGLVVLYAADYILPEEIYPWLGLLSGMLIVVVGLVLFMQRWRAWKRQLAAGARYHSHSHGDLQHSHEAGEEHTHEHGADDEHDAATPHKHGMFSRPHTHMPTDGRKITTGSLLALGVTGGIIPCPTALVVLLAAVAYHQVAVGLLWILAFSLGLATVLTILGLLVVRGRNFLGRMRLGRALSGNRVLVGMLPIFSALAVSGLGFIIAFQAVTAR